MNGRFRRRGGEVPASELLTERMKNMKFTVNRDELQKAILPVTYGVSNVNNPEYKSLLLEVSGDELRVFSYDLEKGIRSIAEVNGLADGRVEADSQKLYAIIGTMPDGEITFETDENSMIHISGSATDFKFLGKDGSGFPNIPDIPGEFSYKLPGKMIRSMIGRTVFSVAANDANPIFLGSLFEIEDDKLKIVSMDRNRIAMRRESVISDLTGEQTLSRFVVPGKAENDLLKVIPDSDDEVEVRMTRKHIMFSFGNIYYISRLLDGDFMNYKRLLSDSNRFEIVVNTREFLDSVTRSAVLLESYKNNFLVINLGSGDMNVSCNTEFGKVDDIIESTFEAGGEETLRIGFNHKILLDALRAIGEEQVRLSFNGPTNPIIFKPVVSDDEPDEERFLYVVMPVQLR